MRMLKRVNEPIKEQIRSVGRIFLTDSWQARQCARNYRADRLPHQDTSCRVVSRQGNKKEAPSVLLWLAPGRLGAE